MTFLAKIASLLFFVLPAFAGAPYPSAPRIDVIDTYHETQIVDPYRWLEKDVRKSFAVRQWVDAQNELSREYLHAIPQRESIKEKLTNAWNYAKNSSPFHRGNQWFQTRNTGLQNHSVVYIGQSQEDINTVLIDPNTFKEDGTQSLSMWSPSPEGSFLAFGISDAGSDWSTWKIRSLKTKRLYLEELGHIKNASPAWVPDESGFYYSRYPESDDTNYVETTDGEQLWFHVLGTEQSRDKLVYSNEKHSEWFYGPSVTKDGGWLVVSVAEGTSEDNGIMVMGPNDDKLRWLDDSFDASISLIGGIGDKLWFKSNRNAPRGKIVSIDMSKKNPQFIDVISESTEILNGADVVGGKLTVTWLKDASTEATVHSLDGKLLYSVKMPGIGIARGFGGDNKDKSVYWSFSSLNQPPSIYTLDLDSQKTTLYWKAEVPLDLSELVVQRVFVKSTDGTMVPMFICSHQDTELDGTNPVLLYGYGGFNIAMPPYFSPSRATWVEMGGVYALACIRGGSEYGTSWHEEGMLFNKQQVFDDFIACGEWLIENKWTSPKHLGIQGGSNGGLLVGACMTQRPDLYGACLPAVGVLDMLRFPLFTVGWAWTSDYGSPNEPEMFKYLLGYSPYHNVRKTCYPPTMVTTGDTDDRVVPAHSFKFAAELQYQQSCDNPILIRIETRAGHGRGTPMHLRIDQATDTYAFLYKNLVLE